MQIVEKDDSVRIEKLELGPFGTNAYVLVCQGTQESVLVDAPDEADRILERLEGTNPKYILITHGHADHIGALSRLRSTLKVPVAAHAADAGALSAPPDILLNDGDMLSFGSIQLTVLYTPGHTPGSLSFVTGDCLISGDTLFPGGPGKTGSPADFKRIVESITGKIFELPDHTRIYPGHGGATTLEKEKKAFEGFSSRQHPPDLHGDVLWASS